MKKYVICIDSSYLAQNVFRSILSKFFNVDTAFHIEDIEVLASEQKPALLILSESSYDEKRWLSALKRSPFLKDIRKIFVSMDLKVPDGFLSLKKPFIPEELLRLCDGKPKNKSKKTKKYPFNKRTLGSKRIFERNIFGAYVYFNDETGRPLIYMKTRDISLGGMFIEGDLPLKIGALTFITFEIEGKRVSITGQVIRTADGGIGLRFMGLPQEAKELIKSYCSNVS